MYLLHFSIYIEQYSTGTCTAIKQRRLQNLHTTKTEDISLIIEFNIWKLVKANLNPRHPDIFPSLSRAIHL